MKKPSSEAKALSLFLMTIKKTDPKAKETAKRINRRWDLLLAHEISAKDYAEEVHKTLETYGGYNEVVEKTVRFYIDKTGEWTLQGDDKYCIDAQKIADGILK